MTKKVDLIKNRKLMNMRIEKSEIQSSLLYCAPDKKTKTLDVVN